jgi:hypothetical protein
MLEDKWFFDKEITPHVTKLVDESRGMIDKRVPLRKVYDYILLQSKDYQERYVCFIMLGMIYQGYKEDHNLVK